MIMIILSLTAVNGPPANDGLPDKGDSWWPDTFYHLHRFSVEVNGIPDLGDVSAIAGPEPAINLPMFEFDASPYSVVRFINGAGDPMQDFTDGGLFCEPPTEGLLASHAVTAMWETERTTIKNGDEDVEVNVGRLRLNTDEPERGSFAYDIMIWFAPAPEDSYVVYAVSGTVSWTLDGEEKDGNFLYKLTNGLDGLDIKLEIYR